MLTLRRYTYYLRLVSVLSRIIQGLFGTADWLTLMTLMENSISCITHCHIARNVSWRMMCLLCSEIYYVRFSPSTYDPVLLDRPFSTAKRNKRQRLQCAIMSSDRIDWILFCGPRVITAMSQGVVGGRLIVCTFRLNRHGCFWEINSSDWWWWWPRNFRQEHVTI